MELSLQETLLQNMWLKGRFFIFVHWKASEEFKGKQIAILEKNLLVSSICSTVEGWEVISKNSLRGLPWWRSG